MAADDAHDETATSGAGLGLIDVDGIGRGRIELAAADEVRGAEAAIADLVLDLVMEQGSRAGKAGLAIKQCGDFRAGADFGLEVGVTDIDRCALAADAADAINQLVQAALLRQTLAAFAPARCHLAALDYTQAPLTYNGAATYNGNYNHGAS